MNSDVIKKPRIVIAGGQVSTTSLAIAEHFGKNHKDVMRDIRKVIEDAPVEFTERNLALSEYVDVTGRPLPMYRLSRNGFVLVAMGFTGRNAMQWKIAYINTFDLMEQHLIGRAAPRVPAAQRTCTGDDFLNGPLFNELYRLFNFQRGQAALMAYLLTQQAHLEWFCNSIRGIEADFGGKLSRQTVIKASRKLVASGLLDLMPGGLTGGGRSRYLVQLKALTRALASQDLDVGVLPMAEEDRLLH